MPRGTMRPITQDPQGFIWFGTDEGVGRYDGYQFKNWERGSERGLTDLGITALAADEKVLWIGTLKGGLNQLDYVTGNVTAIRANPESEDGRASDAIRALALGADGRLWVGTDAGSVSTTAAVASSVGSPANRHC